VLEDKGFMERLLRTTWRDASNNQIAAHSAGFDALALEVVKHAEHLAGNAQMQAASSAERDARLTCGILGHVDPTTGPRAMPWDHAHGNPNHRVKPVRVSDRAHRAADPHGRGDGYPERGPLWSAVVARPLPERGRGCRFTLRSGGAR
jgi:hypothetical protein